MITIFYRHSQRLDEAGMTVVADQPKAPAIKDQLEQRGFLVIEINPGSERRSADEQETPRRTGSLLLKP